MSFWFGSWFDENGSSTHDSNGFTRYPSSISFSLGSRRISSLRLSSEGVQLDLVLLNAWIILSIGIRYGTFMAFLLTLFSFFSKILQETYLQQRPFWRSSKRKISKGSYGSNRTQFSWKISSVDVRDQSSFTFRPSYTEVNPGVFYMKKFPLTSCVCFPCSCFFFIPWVHSVLVVFVVCHLSLHVVYNFNGLCQVFRCCEWYKFLYFLCKVL